MAMIKVSEYDLKAALALLDVYLFKKEPTGGYFKDLPDGVLLADASAVVKVDNLKKALAAQRTKTPKTRSGK